MSIKLIEFMLFVSVPLSNDWFTEWTLVNKKAKKYKFHFVFLIFNFFRLKAWYEIRPEPRNSDELEPVLAGGGTGPGQNPIPFKPVVKIRGN